MEFNLTTCSRCQTPFDKPSHQKNHWCGDCRRKYAREWFKKQPLKDRRGQQKRGRDKRLELINSIKDVPCKDCGVKYPPYVMDFDHIHDNKEFGVALIRQRKLSILLAEIAKCEVVCSNCHRKRTYSRLWQ